MALLELALTEMAQCHLWKSPAGCIRQKGLKRSQRLCHPSFSAFSQTSSGKNARRIHFLCRGQEEPFVKGGIRNGNIWVWPRAGRLSWLTSLTWGDRGRTLVRVGPEALSYNSSAWLWSVGTVGTLLLSSLLTMFSQLPHILKMLLNLCCTPYQLVPWK